MSYESLFKIVMANHVGGVLAGLRVDNSMSPRSIKLINLHKFVHPLPAPLLSNDLTSNPRTGWIPARWQATANSIDPDSSR